MGRQMVTDSWLGGSWWNAKKGGSYEIGILAFEVASLMSQVVHLWHCLSEREIARLREEIASSIGIQNLVSDDEMYVKDLILNEMIVNFRNLAKSVSRLGKRCADTKYHTFEDFIDDPLEKSIEWIGWQYRWKKMERKVRKMERLVAATMNLTHEMEVLAELEQTLRRMQKNASSDKVKLFEFQQKVLWQRQELRNKQELTPWTQTYDYVVRLLLRSLMTVLERIKQLFGADERTSTEDSYDCCDSIDINHLSHSHSFATRLFQSSVFAEKLECQEHHYCSVVFHRNLTHQKAKRSGHVGSLGGCISSFRFDDVHLLKHIDNPINCHKIYSKLSLFSSKRSPIAPPGTLGNAALALRYANIVILIEKLSFTPNMISLDEREELYNMLPATVRRALRCRLRSYGNHSSKIVYDASIAAEWSLQLVQILEWLAPLAHDTIRWQSERNVEEQQFVCQSNVLLVQTLHYADQAKTEAAIVEVLMGLNYLCRTPNVGNDRTTQAPASEITNLLAI